MTNLKNLTIIRIINIDTTVMTTKTEMIMLVAIIRGTHAGNVIKGRSAHSVVVEVDLLHIPAN